ncbi:thiamine diphosphokinase [Roseovarius sp. LXJ103]|nr:thiamine diphosphokinase [Roseovarius carneus]PWE35257.1 thiamine diphosphokinase [Pelagicola sp. LXJ1103]
MIVQDLGPITLLGGGAATQEQLHAAMGIAPVAVAADGGAQLALTHGVDVRAVIGDFDSISEDVRAAVPAENLHHIPEQDSTDFEKCLARIKAPLILGVGFAGGRMDHQMAACNALVRAAHQRCVLLGSDDLIFLAPPSLRLDLPEGARVSLFPLGAVEGVSDGLEWPIQGLNFAPDRQISTSNRALGPVFLSMTAPKMLVMVAPEHLEMVVASLLAAPNWGR